jgi:hypothetical protein
MPGRFLRKGCARPWGGARRRWRRSSPALSPRISELLRLATLLGVSISRLLAEDTGGVVLTSRSDSDLTKFLTICAAALHGDFLRRYPLTAPGELHPLDSV